MGVLVPPAIGVESTLIAVKSTQQVPEDHGGSSPEGEGGNLSNQIYPQEHPASHSFATLDSVSSFTDRTSCATNTIILRASTSQPKNVTLRLDEHVTLRLDAHTSIHGEHTSQAGEYQL